MEIDNEVESMEVEDSSIGNRLLAAIQLFAQNFKSSVLQDRANRSTNVTVNRKVLYTSMMQFVI
jgi:hypothetical protein